MTRRRKKTVAEMTADLANTFPKHQHHDAFLEAAIALRSEDLAKADVAPLEDGAAMRVARAEFRAALHAVFFPPADGRFHFCWSSASQARLLVSYTQEAWTGSNGAFGANEPVHFQAKTAD